jgi:hypothetical protein
VHVTTWETATSTATMPFFDSDTARELMAGLETQFVHSQPVEA